MPTYELDGDLRSLHLCQHTQTGMYLIELRKYNTHLHFKLQQMNLVVICYLHNNVSMVHQHQNHAYSEENNDLVLSVMMDGNIVEELISHNYLGVTIANDVNWRRHIENVATSIAKCLHVLM